MKFDAKKQDCFPVERVRERDVQVIGGPPGGESLLVGMKSGAISKIFIDNPFPVPLLELSSPLRCLDLSLNRSEHRHDFSSVTGYVSR